MEFNVKQQWNVKTWQGETSCLSTESVEAEDKTRAKNPGLKHCRISITTRGP